MLYTFLCICCHYIASPSSFITLNTELSCYAIQHIRMCWIFFQLGERFKPLWETIKRESCIQRYRMYWIPGGREVVYYWGTRTQCLRLPCDVMHRGGNSFGGKMSSFPASGTCFLFLTACFSNRLLCSLLLFCQRIHYSCTMSSSPTGEDKKFFGTLVVKGCFLVGKITQTAFFSSPFLLYFISHSNSTRDTWDQHQLDHWSCRVHFPPIRSEEEPF